MRALLLEPGLPPLRPCSTVARARRRSMWRWTLGSNRSPPAPTRSCCSVCRRMWTRSASAARGCLDGHRASILRGRPAAPAPGPDVSEVASAGYGLQVPCRPIRRSPSRLFVLPPHHERGGFGCHVSRRALPPPMYSRGAEIGDQSADGGRAQCRSGTRRGRQAERGHRRCEEAAAREGRAKVGGGEGRLARGCAPNRRRAAGELSLVRRTANPDQTRSLNRFL